MSNLSIPESVVDIDQRLQALEARFGDFTYNTKKVVQSEVKKRWKIPAQANTTFGAVPAFVVETNDPWKANRVRFYCPQIHQKDTPVKSLPWAKPINNRGGFDDCGAWVPPAGSMIMLVFENGNRDLPYWLGTTSFKSRGPEGQDIDYPMEEYDKYHRGHRGGYLIGPKDESSVYPSWNNESYNGYDLTSKEDFAEEAEIQKKTVINNIYGDKTPQKHMIKYVDGLYSCYHRGKRMEIVSSLGTGMIFKDDFMHDSSSFAHPDCGGEPKSNQPCIDEDGNPVEQSDSCGQSEGGQPGNEYFKHQNECRMYRGPGTPQNNKVELPQTGWQLLTYGGGTLLFDDSVEEPRGIPSWEKSMEDFDFGCTDKITGKTAWISMTGVGVYLSDIEDESGIRGEHSGFKAITPTGNFIELNDHTTGECTAGEKRGVRIGSSALHGLIMADEGNEQCSPKRKGGKFPDFEDGGIPVAKATKGFVKLFSGYGIEVELNDSTDQSKTVEQYFRIFSPQKDNKDRGPHELRMQEKASGPGQVMLRCGGDFFCATYDSHVTVVGDVEKNPSDKITYVSDTNIEITKNFYLNTAKNHALLADEKVFLLAGTDSKGSSGDCGPSIYPVLCLSDRGITISDRVFVSASANAECANIFQLTPFHQCEKPEGCS